MKQDSIFGRATSFGTLRARENFLSFAIKCSFYILPAVLLGNSTDIAVQKIKNDKLLGDVAIHYIVLQTMTIIATLYFLLCVVPPYINEFQLTVSGSFFIVLYFGLQPNYIDMINVYLNE